MNTVTLAGRLGNDPEMRQTNSGTPVVNFSLATRTRQNKEPDWHRIVAFGALAENIHKYKHKGDFVVVSGRLTYSTWENAQGIKVTNAQVIINDCEFVSSPQGAKKETNDGAYSSDIPF